MNPREAIECFHLSFCQRLGARVDRAFFCLKGGCNLRFYFQSFRYSEDIDFDVETISVSTLKKNVEKVLGDATFVALLRHKRIEVVEWSSPKQTETTQRWKVALKIDGQSVSIPTKIEFSRRTHNMIGLGEVEPVYPLLIARHELQTVLLRHYPLIQAIDQKIGALAGRTETQARDVLDLKILKDRIIDQSLSAVSESNKARALKNLAGISFSDFKSQVWPYLLDDYQDHYGKRATWDSLQDEVFKFIEAAPSENLVKPTIARSRK